MCPRQSWRAADIDRVRWIDARRASAGEQRADPAADAIVLETDNNSAIHQMFGVIL